MALHRHYNRNLITNAGEKAFDQALDDLLEDDARTWQACHSVRIGRHPTKKTAEHDFVLVTREGVITVEVKGGLVGMDQGQFIHLPDGREHFSARPFKQDPLHQTHGNAAALIEWTKEENIRDTVVTPAVAFPQCPFAYDGGEHRIIWSKSTVEPLAEFLLGLLHEARRKAPWARDLNGEMQTKLAKAFAPTLMPVQQAEQLKVGAELAARRKAENERILDGLSDNMRIMVQGPPGSGKSPYALRYMKRKADAGQHGLYLCWNELLAARVAQLIAADGLGDQVDVMPFYPFAQTLLKEAGLGEERLDHHTVHQLPALLDEAFATLRDRPDRRVWDYIVADECQDLFHRGIDRVLTHTLRDKEDGLAQGHYLVLYDLTHADHLELGEPYNRILNSAAHYRLAHHFRGTGGDGLNALLEDIETGQHDLDRPYGADVKVVRYTQLKDVPRLVHSQYLTLCGGQAKPEDAVVLLHSTLLRGRDTDPQELRTALEQDVRFECLTPDNLALPARGLRYTTMLKYKGLDKPLVILVMPPVLKWDKKLHHQFLVGASRASVKLCVMVPG